MSYMDSGSQPNLISTAVTNGSEHDLHGLAFSAWTNSRIGESAAFYCAANETNQTAADLSAKAATSLAILDRCEKAEQFAHEAERRLATGGRGAQYQINNAWEAIESCKQRQLILHHGIQSE